MTSLFGDYIDEKSALQILWNRSPVGFAVVSRDGSYTRVNPAYCLLTGYSETELLQKTFQQITHPDDLLADQTESDYLASHPESGGYTMVKRYIRKDNRTVWIELHVSPICGPNGEFERFLVYAVPLPNSGGYKVEESGSGVVVRPVTRWVDIIKDNPRESLVLFSLLFATFKFDLAIQILKSLLQINE